MISDDLLKRLEEAVSVVEKHSWVRVISHYDADGISAAGIICNALLRKGKRFHATLTRSLDPEFFEKVKEEDVECLIISDMGSGQIELMEQLKGDVVVLDHHTIIRESDSVVQVNPHLFGLDGSTQGSASTVSFLFAVAMDESNWDLCGYALAGAISDRQQVPAFSGLNEIVLNEGVERKFIKVEKQLALIGDTLEEGLERTIFPFFKGISGRKSSITKLVKKLGLEPSTKLKGLDGGVKRGLISYLTLQLMKQGARPETVAELTEDRHLIEALDVHASDLGSLMNACGRTGHLGTGLSLCMGDKEAMEEAQKLREEYLSGMMEGLVKLEKEGVYEKDWIQFFYTENASFSGTWAGVGMQYLFNQEKPTIALSVQEKQTRISGRGTRYLVSKGLDLAEAFKVAAGSLDGSGGGHAVASGATIPKGKEDKFLESVDSIVEGQLGSHE
ncbi:MAG: DHH family phosphoesterase [Thermoplasmata archaeon]|nr:DHH family phosphoesterase [Thermoplasmata archaeon]